MNLTTTKLEINEAFEIMNGGQTDVMLEVTDNAEDYVLFRLREMYYALLEIAEIYEIDLTEPMQPL